MKKLTLTVILLLIAIIGVLGLTACGGEGGPGYQPPKPQALRVNAPTTVYQGATDGYSIEIFTVMTDGTESRTTWGVSSLSQQDRDKFMVVGTHTITVNFNGLTTSYQIEVVPSYEGPDGLRFTVNGESATLVGYSNSDPVPETITLPAEYMGVPVTSTEGAIFSNSGIKKIVIPEGYTTIGTNFCVYAHSLEEVVIPKSVTVIGSKAFYSETHVTPVLTKVTYNGTLEEWLGIRFTDAGACPTYRGATLYIGGEALTELNIPDTVEFVSNYAFYGNTGLVSLTATNKTAFYTEAFYKCTNLETVTATAAQLISVERTGIKNLTVIAARDGAENSEKTLVRVNGGNYNNAFSALESVVINDGIVGVNCFAYCKNLKTVVLGDGVTEIQTEAFYECTALEEVTIGKGVVKMGRHAFARTYSLDKVMVKDLAAWCNIEMESAMAFLTSGYFDGVYLTNFADLYVYDEEEEEFSKARYLRIPETVTEIKPYVFAYCNTIVGVKLNEGLEKIGSEAFYCCYGLIHADLSSTVTEIGSNAFSSCNKLYEVINRSEELTVAKDYENGSVGYYATLIKNDAEASTSLTNRDGYVVQKRTEGGSIVNGIDGYWETLVSCYSDSEYVTIYNPDIDYIAPYAFYGLTELKHLTLECPLLEKIDKGAFGNCDLETFSFKNLSMNATEAEVRTHMLDRWVSVVLADNEASPLYGARFFINDTEITEITPEDITVSKINPNAFYGWLGTSVHLSDSVRSIEGSAFTNCPNLATVNTGNGVTTINEYAFRYCPKLTKLVLGASMSNVWWTAFDNDYALVEVYSLNPNFKIGNFIYNLERDHGLPVVYTDLEAESLVSTDSDGYVTAMLGDEKWLVGYVGDSTEITIPDGVTHIAMYMFYDDDTITKLTVPDSVKYLGKYAFAYCANLRDVTLGSGIERICSIALDGLPESAYEWEKGEGINYIKYIGAYCIRGTYLNGEITIREGTRVIADDFKESGTGVQYVTKVNLPEGLITIGDAAFAYHYGQGNITEVNIPSTVTYIGGSAFQGAQLTEVSIPGPDIYIGVSPFDYELTVKDGISSLGSTFLGVDDETEGAFVVADGFKTIQEGAFYNKRSITEITIADSVKYIYDRTFAGCSSLTKITFGSGVEYIGAYIFSSVSPYDTPISEIHFAGTVDEWNAIEKHACWLEGGNYVSATYVQCSDGNVPLN